MEVGDPVADPDFELRRGAGSILLAQPACLHSVISSYSFFTQNTGKARAPRAPPLNPPLGPQVGEVPRLGGVTNLSIQSLFFS